PDTESEKRSEAGSRGHPYRATGGPPPEEGTRMSMLNEKPVDVGPASLPLGVALRPLTMHPDDPGIFPEGFRELWDTGGAPVQWNFVRSEAEVLRGVHVHHVHSDYLIILHGRASIGLRDLRRGSPTEGAVALVEMRGDDLKGLTIPPGVAHGFYFH